MSLSPPWHPNRRRVLATGLAAATSTLSSPVGAAVKRVLTVAAFPNMDKIIEAAQPHWQKLHPDVELEARGLAGQRQPC